MVGSALPRRVALVVLTAAALALLAVAPISGASVVQRLGSWWSSAAPPTKNPGEVKSFTDDWDTGPAASRHLNGKPLTAKARDLLSGLGPPHDTITAFPTTNGSVCYMIEGAGTCVNLRKWPWNTVGFEFGIFSSRGQGTRIFGVAAARVRSVSVEIAGFEHAATFGNHAFYYHLPPGIHERDLQNVKATWKDGSVHSVPFRNWHPPHD